MSKNDFFINIFENPEVVIKMYISEISKSKISEQKAQKMTTNYETPCISLSKSTKVLIIYINP